jgi:NDP-sugar pyrophosphorylase family protein
MAQKVCILAAGVGNKMGELTEHTNIALLPVNNKATISYIVEKFPVKTEFVIAVGHKKESVMDYLKLAHPERKFTFVQVDKFTGPGSGPGYSILQCRKHLKEPFVFFTADTMVLEDIPPVDQNWIGVAPVKETELYCTVRMRNNLVVQLDNKIKTDNKFAFIGLGGVKDHEEFFEALRHDQESQRGEVQVVTGFSRLIEKKLVPIGFTWFDTGSLKNYIDTNRNFSGGGKKFDFSKGDEFLYFVNGRVIKFFADAKAAKNRYERATKHLKGLAPKMEAHRGNLYSYKLIEGQTLYSVLDSKKVRDFLGWASKHLWKPINLDSRRMREFVAASKRFYKDKTLQRIEAYRSKVPEPEFGIINGLPVPMVSELLSRVDWDYVSESIPVPFHGDLQFDNVLYVGEKGGKHPFVLLDWRQDFGGVVHAGDLYYDLAKLYGGVTMSYPLIKEGMFSYTSGDGGADFKYYIKSDLLEARHELEDFILKHNYDLAKVKLITAIIFLNMAPLHKEPFDRLLFHFGRSSLHKALS